MLAPEGTPPFGWLTSWWRCEWIAAGLLLLSAMAGLRLVVSRIRSSNAERWVLALGVAGIAYMLIAAPTWRFGLGYLVLLPALFVARYAGTNSVLPTWMRLPGRLGHFALAGTVAGLFIALHVHLVPRPSYRLLDEILAAGLIARDDHPHFNPVLPPRTWNIGYYLDKATGRTVANPSVIVQDEVGGIRYFRIEDAVNSDQCWDAPLPCAWQRLEKIRLRVPMRGVSGGFELTLSGEK
jgi:hypothetical protein